MNSIKTIMRTSAMIFAEEQSPGSSKAVKRHFVEAVFANMDNQSLTLETVITKLQTDFELTFLENDIQPILTDNRYFVEVLGRKTSENTYYLPEIRYRNILKRADYSIEDAIEQYLSKVEIEASKEDMRQLLYRFLYTVLNTNITAFSQLLEKKQNSISSVIDRDKFEDDEIVIINDFINWDESKKDRALFELVNYCIEYAAAFNSINPSDVVSALRNKHLYLDNAMLYRLLGINGEFRKQRAISLLDRCVQSGQHIYISSVTRAEFFDTIDFHLNQLNKSTPYGNINPYLFKKFSDGGGFYYYYHEWRRDKLTYGYTSMKQHIKNEYNALCKRYGIIEDYTQPYNDIDDSKTIETYVDGIKEHKLGKNQYLHENDAKNILWIEKARKGNDHNIKDTKYYFVTTDRKLQEWDISHSKNQPVTMLPSQWLALLLKFFSQSGNDYKSFVSFLTIPKDSIDISPEDLQQMLAGISEITEEFKLQEDIVSSLLEDENTKGIRSREEAKRYAKEKIETQYEQQLLAQHEKAKSEMIATNLAHEKQIKELQDSFEKMMKTVKSEFEKQEEQRGIEKLREKLNVLKKNLKDSEDKYTFITEQADDYKKELGRWAVLLLFIYVAIIIFLIYKLGWEIMEPCTYVISLIISVIIEGYTYVKLETLNPLSFLSHKRDIKYKSLCNKLGFSLEEMKDYEQDIEKLLKQLGEFSTSATE